MYRQHPVTLQVPNGTKEKTSVAEKIDHPDHYQGGVECIDVMEQTQGRRAVQDFCICNAIKYLWRHKKKNGLEDIKKAIWYLNKFVEMEEKDT